MCGARNWFHLIRIGTDSRASRVVEPDVEHVDIERGLARLPEPDGQATQLLHKVEVAL